MAMTLEDYKQAEFNVATSEAKRGFKIHAVVFSLVITGLAVLNALLIAYTDADFPWVIFPFLGWGIGLTFHYIGAYRSEGREVLARQATIEQYAKNSKIAA